MFLQGSQIITPLRTAALGRLRHLHLGLRLPAAIDGRSGAAAPCGIWRRVFRTVSCTASGRAAVRVCSGHCACEVHTVGLHDKGLLMHMGGMCTCRRPTATHSPDHFGCRSRRSERNDSLLRVCMEKLGSAPDPIAAGAPAAPARQASGNLSDGGVYSCDDLMHATAATVEVAFSGGEWHVSDPDAATEAGSDVGVGIEGEDRAAAAKPSISNWAELPDGILREVCMALLLLE